MASTSNSPISIVIPVYNQAGTLAETLESVLNQTVKPAEIIVSENHSTDGTAEVLAAYRNRVRVVRPPMHLGMMQNWNFGVEQVQSDWLALLSGDDLARPIYVEALTRGLRRANDAVLVRGNWDRIDAGGKVTITHRQLSVKPVVRPPAAVREQIFGPKLGFAAFTLKRSVCKKVGGFDSRMHLNADWAMWLSAAELGAIIHVPEVISGYREVSRPELERKRLPLRVADEYYTHTEIYPRLTKRWALGAEVRAARRERLIDLLGYAAKFPVDVLNAEDRGRLREMAALCGLTSEYARWDKDPTYLPSRPLHALKLAARKMAHRAVAALRQV